MCTFLAICHLPLSHSRKQYEFWIVFSSQSKTSETVETAGIITYQGHISKVSICHLYPDWLTHWLTGWHTSLLQRLVTLKKEVIHFYCSPRKKCSWKMLIFSLLNLDFLPYTGYSKIYIMYAKGITEEENETIKDGDIAPWLIWNNLSTWPNWKIWTKRKEKDTEKNWTIEMGRMVERFLFSAGLRAFGA